MNEFLPLLTDFTLSTKEFFIRLLIALGSGFLIGLEREHSAMLNKEERFAGVRTFILVTLLGFIGGLLYFLLNQWIYFAIFLSVITLIGISYYSTSKRGDIGGTTEFTALIAFLLGTLILFGFIEQSVIITVLVVTLLSVKFRLQKIIISISKEEMYAFIRFVIGALLILPLLPDETFGPFNVVNPREIGWIIILTSGLGFLGYLLMKFLGHGRGILITGIVGGLISSTMVTWIFARKSKESPELSSLCATAIMAASSIMILRVLIWVLLFNRPLAEALYLPLAIIFAAAIGISFYLFKIDSKGKSEGANLPEGKPLDVKSALVFGFIYTFVLLLVSFASDRFGNEGLLISSVISGLTDVDAITISVAKLANTTLESSIAHNAILLGTISNTVVKAGIAVWAGSTRLRKYILIGYGSVFLAAALAFLLLNI